MKVGVIGLGYVGLPLAVAFAEAGDGVIALDVDPLKVSAVAAGDSYIEDIPSERLREVLPKIRATYRYADLAQADAVIICVPTPLTENREPDLGPLDAAAKSLAQVLQPGQLIVLESTTYPGTTRERLLPLLESSGLRVGTDINLAFSPERVDPGRTDYTLRSTPKVIGGMTPACLDRADDLYSRVCDHLVRVSTPEAAEMTKLLENIFRSVNIALVNELAMLASGWASTSGRSSTPRRPSPTGSCASSRARAWAATASPSTPSTSPGAPASSTCRPSSSSSPARSTSTCPTTAPSAWSRRSTTSPSRSRARES